MIHDMHLFGRAHSQFCPVSLLFRLCYLYFYCLQNAPGIRALLGMRALRCPDACSWVRTPGHALPDAHVQRSSRRMRLTLLFQLIVPIFLVHVIVSFSSLLSSKLFRQQIHGEQASVVNFSYPLSSKLFRWQMYVVSSSSPLSLFGLEKKVATEEVGVFLTIRIRWRLTRTSAFYFSFVSCFAQENILNMKKIEAESCGIARQIKCRSFFQFKDNYYLTSSIHFGVIRKKSKRKSFFSFFCPLPKEDHNLKLSSAPTSHQLIFFQASIEASSSSIRLSISYKDPFSMPQKRSEGKHSVSKIKP